MRIRDKIITAVCRTVEGIEWTTVKVGQDGIEPLQKEAIPVEFAGETAEELLASIVLPENVSEQIKGDISVPLRSTDLLMRVMELPATQPEEIADMAALQVDKISPFPVDQLAYSHEILQTSNENSLVLMATAKRSCIDRLGEIFQEKGVHIHSIDSRDLGWLQLLDDAEHISKTDCEIIIIDDGIEFSLIITNKGFPLAFRTLHASLDDPTAAADEILYEISYTLTTLDTEYTLKPATSIQFWSQNSISSALRSALTAKSGLTLHALLLGTLPPLSEGIVRRALATQSRIELIPSEWIEHEKSKKLRQKSIRAGVVILGVWLLVLLVFFSIYKVRDMQLSSVKKQAAAIAPEAQRALQNRQKLRALKVYTDRSDSALECLREITQRLPIGDIEFVSYNYDKIKGVSIRGTAGNDSTVDDFLVSLADSKLFERVKNQSMSTKTTRGVRRTVFSVSLTLPVKESSK